MGHDGVIQHAIQRSVHESFLGRPRLSGRRRLLGQIFFAGAIEY